MYLYNQKPLDSFSNTVGTNISLFDANTILLNT